MANLHNSEKSKNHEANALANDYLDILYVYRDHGKVCATRRVTELRSQSNVDNYYAKLLHFVVKHLLVRIHHHPSPDICTALKDFREDILLITLLSGYVDLSTRDELGRMPVDHFFQLLFGSLRANIHHVIPQNHAISVDDEDILQLLFSLMDRTVLNAHFRWGFSYFSILVLFGWWKAVERGLDSGADVLQNGICKCIPIDAVFVMEKCHTVPIPFNIFKRLFNPSIANRPIVDQFDWACSRLPRVHEDQNATSLCYRELPLPIHRLINKYPNREDLFLHLLHAGARIDIRNIREQLPVEIYALFPSKMKLSIFKLLIPNQRDTSQFLKLLLSILQKFDRHLGNFWITKMSSKGSMSDLCFAECIINTLTDDDIGPRYVPELTSESSENTDESSRPNLEKIQKKWDQYRTAVPSLSIQCVHVIRSSLRDLTKEQIQSLSLPKLVQEKVLLTELIELIFHRIST